MTKILSFVVIAPLIVILLLKASAFYEYDTKQRYIKNLVDGVAYKVKLTGVFDTEGADDLKKELEKLIKLDEKSIVMKYSTNQSISISEESIPYTQGFQLERGSTFSVSVKSANVSQFSLLQNLGVSNDENKNLRYVAKAVCCVEYAPEN